MIIKSHCLVRTICKFIVGIKCVFDEMRKCYFHEKAKPSVSFYSYVLDCLSEQSSYCLLLHADKYFLLPSASVLCGNV